MFKQQGWNVDVASAGDEPVLICDQQFDMCWSRSPFTWKTIAGIKELRSIVNEGGYDVVYCHTPVGGFVARLASRKARKHGTKVIYCAHGLHFYKGAPLVNWLFYYPVERLLTLLTDALFVVNTADYEHVRHSFSLNRNMVLKLVPEVGVNFDRLQVSEREAVRKQYREQLGIGEGTTALIYVAELLPNKNQTMLVDVLRKLIAEGEDVCLILPGPEHSTVIREYIRKNEMENYVRLLGWRNDIGELLVSSDICTASSIREGFGINLVEAMYCGLPVVATDNRGHREIVRDGENGFLVGINDVDAMAAKVKRLIHDEKLRNRFSGFDVSKYDCNSVAKTLYHIIDEIAE